MHGYNKCLVDLAKVFQYIFKYNTTKGRYIFSEVMEKSVGEEFYNSQTIPSNHHKPVTGHLCTSQQLKYATGLCLTNNVPVNGTYNNAVDICDGQIPVSKHYSYHGNGSNKRCRQMMTES